MTIFLVVKNFSETLYISQPHLDYQSLESLDETDHDLDSTGGVQPHPQAHLDVQRRGNVHHGLGGAHQDCDDNEVHRLPSSHQVCLLPEDCLPLGIHPAVDGPVGDEGHQSEVDDHAGTHEQNVGQAIEHQREHRLSQLERLRNNYISKEV